MLGSSKHSSPTRVRTKIINLRPFIGCGLGPVPEELGIGLFVVKTFPKTQIFAKHLVDSTSSFVCENEAVFKKCIQQDFFLHDFNLHSILKLRDCLLH